jgi:hypothetical protein
MSDFTSKSPKGYAQDGDKKYRCTMDDDDISTFTYSTKIPDWNKGSKTKWQKKKK